MVRLLVRAGMRSILPTLIIVFSVEWQGRLAGSADPGSLLEQLGNSVFRHSQSGTALRHPNRVLPPRPRHEAGATSVGQRAREAATAAQLPAPAASKDSARTGEARNDSGSMPDGRTAIYDIAAHAVYLPNGDTLEAHSGLGSSLDDPRYVSVKNRGPTPPNVYDLVLRKQPFHGIRAIRLVPVDEDKMFGRDGMLAHSYMHGPNGQSKGCVSFRDYPVFLSAFLKGEVERLVVVDHRGDDFRYAGAFDPDAPL